MPVFVYQALQAGGGKTTGEIEAVSRQDAFSKLRTQNLQPFSLAAKGAEAAASAASVSASGENILNRQQVLLFTEELCELLDLTPPARASTASASASSAPAAPIVVHDAPDIF